MAVAHVAVQMGPRNTRRLAAGALVVGVIAVIAVAGLLTRTPHSGSGSSAGSKGDAQAVARFEANAKHLVYGMSPQQVRQLAGKPTTIRGRCWLYRPKAGVVGSLSTRTVGSLSLGQPGSIAARSSGVLRLCFLSGALSDSYRHIRFQGHWEWSTMLP